MTPLEAAKALAAKQCLTFEDPCYLCAICGGAERMTATEDIIVIDHKPDCSWLQMPAIVAALEAATVMATRMARQRYCNGCGHEGGNLSEASGHDQNCERWALISAIQGIGPIKVVDIPGPLHVE